MLRVEIHDGERIASSVVNPADFAIIFERHFDAIHRYVTRRLGTALADDIAAQVFVEAFAGRRARFDVERADSLPWLYGIATNLARRHHKRTYRLGAHAKYGVDPVGIDATPHQLTVAAESHLGADPRPLLLTE